MSGALWLSVAGMILIPAAALFLLQDLRRVSRLGARIAAVICALLFSPLVLLPLAVWNTFSLSADDPTWGMGAGIIVVFVLLPVSLVVAVGYGIIAARICRSRDDVAE